MWECVVTHTSNTRYPSSMSRSLSSTSIDVITHLPWRSYPKKQPLCSQEHLHKLYVNFLYKARLWFASGVKHTPEEVALIKKHRDFCLDSFSVMLLYVAILETNLKVHMNNWPVVMTIVWNMHELLFLQIIIQTLYFHRWIVRLLITFLPASFINTSNPTFNCLWIGFEISSITCKMYWSNIILWNTGTIHAHKNGTPMFVK
jgi:hypothetical protein